MLISSNPTPSLDMLRMCHVSCVVLIRHADTLTAEALELQQINDERAGTIEEIRAAQEADAPKVAALEAQV